MDKKALLILAEGFEEIEAAAPIDILRRAGVQITIAGVGTRHIQGAQGMVFEADCLIDQAQEDYDAVILPGGMPGARHLRESAAVIDLIRRHNEMGKIIGAICASPALVLTQAAILGGKTVTCYPGFEKNFGDDVVFSKEAVVKDGNIITSRGPGTAHLFAFELVRALVSQQAANDLSEGMLYAV